jgi:4-alpha-glucanotransferase
MQFPTFTSFLTGIAVPVFALRSEESCGTGEFADLIQLGTWCQAVGLDVIQILPVNDTGADPSPYSARSAFALHPLFIRLSQVPGAEPFAAEIDACRQRLDPQPRLSYTDVLSSKLTLLRRIYESQKTQIHQDRALHDWITANPWLQSYCIFCLLQDHHQDQVWQCWGPWRVPQADQLEHYWHVHQDDVLFHAWVQYHLEQQLRQAALALSAMGIALKGDIPILLAQESADVWAYPELFNLDWRVGAPPDMFSPEGQNWQFPSINWAYLERTAFTWWRQRLQHAARFYHAFRLDHVLGFFRVWIMPAHHTSGVLGRFEPTVRLSQTDLLRTGLSVQDIDHLAQTQALLPLQDGFTSAWHYYRNATFQQLSTATQHAMRALVDTYWERQEELWRDIGLKRLSAISQASDMLVCAEDLGTVPACVPDVLAALNILGLRIERWSRAWNEPNQPFIDPKTYPRLSVCAPSTHDTPTLRGWWEEMRENRDQYCALLGLMETCPPELTPDLSAKIIERNLQTNSLLCIFTIQDLLGLESRLRTSAPADERINVPGDITPFNWTYRMPASLETLIGLDTFNHKLKRLIEPRRHRPLTPEETPGRVDRT